MSSKSVSWLLLGAALMACAAHAQQQAPKKKLYCWNDASGARVCGDTLPGSAVNQAHDEFSANSGHQTGSVARAPTADEQAAAEAAAKQQRADALAEEARQRTEQAMLASYDSETDLDRVFDEQRSMVDNDIKTAHFNLGNQRIGLEQALRAAGEKELSGGKVDAKTVADIRRRHAALLQQQALAADFEHKRKDIDAQAAAALARYREIKGIADPAAATASATPASATATR